jgi:hypothetical protein
VKARDRLGGLMLGVGLPLAIAQVAAEHPSPLELGIGAALIVAGGVLWAEADDRREEQMKITIAVEPNADRAGAEVLTVRDKAGRLIAGAPLQPDPFGGSIELPEAGRLIQQAHLTGRRAAG